MLSVRQGGRVESPCTPLPLSQTSLDRSLGQEFIMHLRVILDREGIQFDQDFDIQRFGKLRLQDNTVLHSRLVEKEKEKSSRCHRWFEAHQGTQIIFGEALAFYQSQELEESIVIYYPILDVESKHNTLRGKWGHELQVLSLQNIYAIVGIWQMEGRQQVYILRKHPALEWLTPEERNIREEDLEHDEE